MSYNGQDKEDNGDYFSHVYQPSMEKLLGSISGKTLLELACGNGADARVNCKKATYVVGVDVSQFLISIAKEQTIKEGIKNVEYHVRDCSKPINLGKFDCVYSAFLLNHAENYDELKNMIKIMYDSLHPNCYAYGTIPNFGLPREDFPKLWKYGIQFVRPLNVKTGDIQTIRWYEGPISEKKFKLEIIDHYTDLKDIEKAFYDIGFVDFKWVGLELGEQYEHLREFYKEYLKCSVSIMFKARKKD